MALQRMLQPGQVLVRQVIPGISQPVFRAITLQPGQMLPGQVAGAQPMVQTLPPGVRPSQIVQHPGLANGMVQARPG